VDKKADGLYNPLFVCNTSKEHFSLTKLEIRAEQVLPGSEGGSRGKGERGGEEEK
jgi:hypothetical protein